MDPAQFTDFRNDFTFLNTSICILILNYPQEKIPVLLFINILNKEKRASLMNYVSGIMDHLQATVQECTSSSKPLEIVFVSIKSLSTNVNEIKA